MKKIRKLSLFSGFSCLEKMRLRLEGWIIMMTFMCGMPCLVFAQDQRVTIHVTNVDIQVVFKQIKEQANLNFVYNADQLKEMKSVTLNVNNVTVNSVLKTLFDDTPFEYKFEMSSIVIRQKKATSSQVDKNIKKSAMLKGKVVDNRDKKPIPGVTVVVKGTSVGVVTNIDGCFSLMIPDTTEHAELVFSFVGMKSRVIPYSSYRNIGELIVSLEEDLLEMDEVVVTGYTTLSRRETASAVSQVKAEQVMLNSKSSIDQMLIGQIPGMAIIQTSGEPSATPKIRIRGTSSITSSKAPIWVVDGVILEDPVNVDYTQLDGDDAAYLIGNAIAGINPRDIETVTVLKDASATAIYGVQAANGVIVLTTKMGKEGKAQLSYSSSITWNQRVSYGDLYLMNAAERIQVSQEIIDKKITYGRVPTALGYEGLYMRYMNREMTYDEFVGKVKKMAKDNTDWYDILFRNVFNHNHTVNLSGGARDTRYYTSIGLDQNFGTAKGSDSKRYTALMKLDSKLNESCRLGLSLNGSVRQNGGFHSSVNPNKYAYETSRTIPCYNEDGSLFFYKTRQNSLLSSAEAPKEEIVYNIVHELQQTGSEGKVVELIGQLNFQWRIKYVFMYDFAGSYNYQQSKQDSWATEESNFVALKRKYKKGSLEANSPEENQSEIPVGGIINKSETEKISYMVRNKLSYANQFGEHEISGSFISEIRSTRTKGFSGTYYGWMPERGQSISPMITSGYQKILSGLSPKILDNQVNYVSWAGVLAYTWRNKFTLNGNIRMDGSNKFGENPKYRFLPIWSIAGRYALTEEAFLKKSKVLSLFAIRASYGIQGNVDKSTSPELVIQVGALNTSTRMNESYFEYLPNPDLRWEKTTSYNLGADFSFFNDLIAGTFDFYHKVGVDMIMPKQVSQSMGLDYVKINAGKLNNTGYELDLRFYPIRNTNYSFNVNFIYSYNKNKVVKANGGIDVTNAEKLAGTALIEGKPFGVFYSYRFAGINGETGYPVFYDKDGKDYMEVDGVRYPNYALYEEELALVESGTKDPTSSGSIGLNFRYKNFRLSVNMSYSLGGVDRLPNIYRNEYYSVFDPITNLPKDLKDRWQKPGDEKKTIFPTLYDSRVYKEIRKRSVLNGKVYYATQLYDYTDARVAKTDNLRLRSIGLNYRLPGEITSKLWLQEFSVNFQVTNLFVIKAKEWRGRDPESGDSNIPMPRTYSVGVNVTF